MKKIFIGIFAIATVSSTIVIADNGKKVKKATVVCSKGCTSTTNCIKGSTCAVMLGCVCS